MTRGRGGFIGANIVPAAAAFNSAASGLWTLRDQESLKRAGTWPRASIDAFYSSVVLLLNMNGTNGSTTFTDSSASAKTVTRSGDAAISTTQSKFGGASAVFDGTGDFLSVANNADFDFGSGDLTIEAWVYISASSTADLDGTRGANIVSTWNAAPPITGYALNIIGSSITTGTGLAFDTWGGSDNGTFYRATVAVAQSQWHHIAATVSGGTRRLFLNGTEANGITTTLNDGYTQANSLSNAFRVGRTQLSGYPNALNGFIDDLRITKGVARYTANFTPPTAEFPSLT
jgi:hypothetical protein